MFRDHTESTVVSAPESLNLNDRSAKEKKILPGRRHQRHSTEIGSEYHRWWAIRSAVGFETNEHIAGLLLDGYVELVVCWLCIFCSVSVIETLDLSTVTVGNFIISWLYIIES